MIFVTVSLILMTVDHRFQHLETARSTLKWLISPLQHIVDLPFRAGSWASREFSTHETLMEENQALFIENIKLQAELQQLKALKHENQRLRELMNAAARLEHEVVIAELLSVDLDPYRQEILINRGEKDQVYVGQPLLDAHGVMGQIIRVNRFDATAMLISDPSHALPVQFDNSELRTLAVGTGKPDVLELRHIPNSADIKVGDTLSASGLGGRFPQNYPVAEVTRVDHIKGEPFAQVQARPLARLDRSREVLLVFSVEPDNTSEEANEAPPGAGEGTPPAKESPADG